MPFVANMDDEEEQKPGSVAPVGGGAVHLAPSSGVGGTAPGGTSAAPAKDAGGSFGTLDKYLTANQGQAAPLAGKITGAIDDQYKTLDQGNQGVLSGISGQVTSAPGYTKGDNALIAKESADPTSFANDTNNISSFQKQLMNSYGGPNSAEGTNDYQAQQAKLNDAISQGKAQTETAAGRTQLIAKNSAAPTTGVTALNSAILSQDPNYLGSVENAYKPFSNLVSNLGAGAADINKTIASEQNDAATSSKSARDAITGQISGLNTAVGNQTAQAQQAATARNAALKSDLSSGKVSDQDLSDLGISKEQWDSLSGAQKAAAASQIVSSADNKFQANTGTANIDLANQLTQRDPNAEINAANTATADQYNQTKAFQSLLSGLNLDTPALSLNPADASKAGTAPANLNSYDYKTALQGTQDTAAAEKASAQAYVDALQSGADEEHAQLAAKEAAKNTAVQGIASLGNPLIGGTTGGLVGQYNAAKNIITNPSLKSLESAPATVAKGIVSGATSAVKTVTNIFCFHEHTPVIMKRQGGVLIKDIQLGDETLGGKVLAIKVAFASDMYSYEGVLVTGKHAVYENGVWLRIEDTISAVPMPGTYKVYNLVTSDHTIWVNGIMFSDEHETDHYETLDLDESLMELNRVPVR